MTDATRFTMGVDVRCRDGVCGELSGVVVDPAAWAVTHLVVEPKNQDGPGRLVPLDLVDAPSGEIWLDCTSAAFGKLDAAEQTEFLPGPDAYAGFAPGGAFLAVLPALLRGRRHGRPGARVGELRGAGHTRQRPGR